MSVPINSLVQLPLHYLGALDADRIVRELTFTPSAYERRVVTPIPAYVMDETRGRIGLPIHYGLQELMRLHLQDSIECDLTMGYCPLLPPRIPTPRDETQDKFFRETLHSLQNRYTALVTAKTGSGKTVCALWAGSQLNVSMLVIVDSHDLVLQWRTRIKEHLGLTDDQIGEVSGPNCNYRDKQITLAVIHNLSQKQFDPDFYSYFGFVVWDECHILGAESFSKSLPLFNARYRLAMTATPSRRDGCFQMVEAYFGPPCVLAEMPAVPLHVRVLDYRGPVYRASMPKAILLNRMADDFHRNHLIVDTTVAFHRGGERFLVVSDRINHLEALMRGCAQQGIPWEHMGLHAKQATNDSGSRSRRTSEQLEVVRQNSRIIFATYNTMEKGVDVPDLFGGIDATPRAAATQLVGRVRRQYPGKTEAVWFTIRDLNSVTCLAAFQGRLRDYKTDNNIRVTYGPT